MRGWLRATPPVLDLLLHLVLLVPVTLLDPALQLLALSVDHVEVIVCELAPLLLHLALHLLPAAFEPIPIHLGPPHCLGRGYSRPQALHSRRSAAARRP